MKKIYLLFVTFIILIIYIPSLAFEKKFLPVFLPNGVEITAEVVIDEADRQRGLMFRESINPDQGMLFVFEDENFHSFWMKNMKISIDILWLDKNQRIVHIEKKVPPCKKDPCPSYPPGLPAKYVLELKDGSVEKHGLKLYDRIDFILL
jgi:uncharacterized membrane protein (UPF0127 family)